MTTTTWPEGVLYRARTLGGATVDITLTPNDGWESTARAACTGCPEAKDTDRLLSHAGGNAGEADQHALDEALDWANDHANCCRFLPRPGSAA